MATEILVNDGGAPSRILPFTASAAVNAGYVVEMHTDSKVRQDQGAASKKTVGFAFTDAVADGPASIITGKGVLLNLAVTGSVTVGGTLIVDAAGAAQYGVLKAGTTAGSIVAQSLEQGTGTGIRLVKCLTM